MHLAQFNHASCWPEESCWPVEFHGDGKDLQAWSASKNEARMRINSSRPVPVAPARSQHGVGEGWRTMAAHAPGERKSVGERSPTNLIVPPHQRKRSCAMSR